MPASTSSRKSFTQRDYVRSSTDGVGIDLYSRQDTRMYHYLYARGRHLLTYARASTHTCACTRSNWKENSRTRYTYGMSCLDWHRSCLSNRYVGLFSPSSTPSSRHSRSLAVYNFTSGFKTHDAAISRPTMCAPLTRPLFPFSGLCESWIMRQVRDCHAEPVTREEKHAPRNGRYFHPNARYISLRPRLSAP